MKFLICGVGSIGERYIRNLLSLGYEDIILFRQRELPLRTIERTFPVYKKLSEALATKPNVAIICNPTHLHLETALECAQSSCHLIIEKPISHTLFGKKELCEVLAKNKRIALVAYMLRYHPAHKKIKELIVKNKLGKIVSLRSIWADYLPDWHPWEDYRTSYAALKEMGGGPALTLSHEIDLAYWFLGDVKKVVGTTNKSSNLELSTEHGVDIALDFKNGATGNIHLDFHTKPTSRSLEIKGSEGSIKFEYLNNKLEIFYSNHDVEIFNYKEFDRNNMFIDELKDFIDCVRNNKPSPISVEEGFVSVEIALEAIK